MRQIKLSWTGLLAALFISAGIFVGCQKDDKLPNITSGAEAESCCVGSWPGTLTQLFRCGDQSSGFLTIYGQNTANSLTFNISRSGDLNKNTANRFTRVEWTIKQGDNEVASGSTEQSDNSPKTEYSFTYALPEGALVSCDKFQIELVIKGLEGFNALPVNCANEWSGQGQGVFAKTFEYTVKTVCSDNPNPPTCGNLRTQTLGFWGASPTGTKLLNSRWSEIGTLTIGCGSNTKSFTSQKQVSDAIKGYTGTPAKLPTLSTFSAQVITLSINTKLWPEIKNLVVVSGTFAGYSVEQVLALANAVLGGCNTSYTPSELNKIADAINNSFDNGVNKNTGVVACP